MAGHVAPEHYSNLTAFLATAGVVVPLAKRLKLSPVLGFLGAGVLLGPQVLGRLVHQAPILDYITVTQPANIQDLAQFGVVFLLFMIGLELSWERLMSLRRLVFGLGGGFTLAAGAIAAAVAMALGLPLAGACAVGAALAVSSTAVVLPVLAERGRLHAPAGRAAFGILLFQDLAVAPVLVALSVIGGHPSGGAGGGVESGLVRLGIGVAGLAASMVVGRLLLRPLFASAARAKSPELFMAASLLVVIASSLLAASLGLSMALGAFAAGVLLAETEFRHEVEVLIDPFKGLLHGLSFLSVGVALNLELIAQRPVQIVGVAVALLVMKAVVGTGAARLFRLAPGDALETGLLVAAGGEFAFVILGDATATGLVPAALAQALIVTATLSLMAAPGLAALGERLNNRGRAAEPLPPPHASDEPPRVLVVGYGRVGRMVSELLDGHGILWLAVERSPREVRAAGAGPRRVYSGDAARPELLARCGLETAPAVVVTMDSPDAAEAVVAAVRRIRPDVPVVVRARDARQARRLYELGATDAVPETVEASLQLSEAVLVGLGVPMGLVIASIHERRDEVRRSLISARAAADPAATASLGQP